jgi:urea transport system permease protein
VGIINPSEMSPANSIEIAIWAAVGGRGTLFGPILGAFAVNGAKSWFTVAYPEYWLYFLGGLFVLVTLLLPRGLLGLAETLRARRPRAATPAGAATQTQPPAAMRGVPPPPDRAAAMVPPTLGLPSEAKP